MKVSVHLMGGLGNQLFQMAFLDYISKNTGYIPCVERIDYLVEHSQVLYFNCIFWNWRHLFGQMSPLTQEVHEDKLMPQNWISIVRQKANVRFVGYFQNYKYVTPEFISKLTFDRAILNKYPDIGNSVFLHIRGGDFLQHHCSWLHNFPMDDYYQRAISMFPNSNFVIFTNDIEYAKTKPFLKDITYSFIEENEIDSLLLMSKCSGGICANSTFSWWGAFLNTNRKLILPSRYFNNPEHYINGYYFDGCTIVEV